MEVNNQQIVREALNLFLERSEHGAINEISHEVGISRQGLGKWRSGEVKRLKPENLKRIKDALMRRGHLPESLGEAPTTPADDLQKARNEALLSLASALESLVVELRSEASPTRKAMRLRWEIDNLRAFIAEHFGE